MANWKRSQYVQMAKCVRNSTMSKEGRRSVIQLMCEVFREDNQFFDEKTFRAIANAELEDDNPQYKGVKKNAV